MRFKTTLGSRLVGVSLLLGWQANVLAQSNLEGFGVLIRHCFLSIQSLSTHPRGSAV